MQNLYKLFITAKNEKEFFNVLDDVLTPTEIREVSERWNIAQLLATTNLKQEEIANKLNCGQATITRVSRCLKEGKSDGYRNAINLYYPKNKLS